MLKVLLVIAVAYLFRRFGILKAQDSHVLNSYVINFALPLLVFKSMHSLGLSLELINVPIYAWIAILSCLAVSFLFGRFLKLDDLTFRSFLLSSSFGNTAFLGYPITYSYYGEKGLSYAILYDNIGSFLMVSSLGVAIASFRVSLIPIVKFPPFWGLVTGLLFSQFQIPGFFRDFLEFVSLSVLPVILFSVGLNISLSSIRKNLKLSILVIFIKMVLSPALTLGFVVLAGLEPLQLKVTVLEASMPTMIFASILAMRYGLNYHLAFASAGLGMALSFIYVPILVKILNTLT